MVYDEIFPELLNAKDYRSFLKLAFVHLKNSSANFSYQRFSMRAGFSSRSYLRDIMEGHKRLTPAALPKVCKGLKLPIPLRKHLQTLAALEEPDLNPDEISRETLLARLKKSQANLNKKRVVAAEAERSPFYRFDLWVPVYAALGDPKAGALPEVVAKRTRIPLSMCKRVLQEMSKSGVVEFDRKTHCYIAGKLHYIFEAMGADAFFKREFLKLMTTIQKTAEKSFERKDRLYFSSTFSVQRNRLPELREQLRALLQDFVEASELPLGDSVAEMVVGFQPFNET